MQRLGFGLIAVVIVAGAFQAIRHVAASGGPEKPAKAAETAAGGKMLKLWSETSHGYVSLPAVVKSDEEWKAQLGPLSYQVTRQAGTERAFTGPLNDEHRKGVFHCVACGTDLFRSDAKFDSGTGWPSFFQPIAKENVSEHLDQTPYGVAIEIRCRRCGAHLGHVFSDGPKPTGLRYCMNSAALTFTPADK